MYRWLYMSPSDISGLSLGAKTSNTSTVCFDSLLKLSFFQNMSDGYMSRQSDI